MQPISNLELPLWNFFNALNENHTFKLGTDNFLLLFSTLQKSQGQIDIDELHFLCKLLWFKPNRYEQGTFDKLFETSLNHIATLLKTKTVEDNNTESITTDKTKKTDKTSHKNTTTTLPQQHISRRTKKRLGDRVETIYIQIPEDITTTTQTPFEVFETNVYNQSFILTGTYFNLTKRTMQQSWRSLRNLHSIRDTKELDITNTINKVTQTGFLNEISYLPEMVNRTHLIILIDNSPSMVAFHDLSKQLITTAKADKGIKYCDIYYFNNVPERYLFLDETHTKVIRVEDLPYKETSSIFIFSDAGAARNDYVKARIQKTKAFMKKIGFVKSAWLNPMPNNRWKNTSAKDIATFVNMLSISNFNFKNIILLLKGKIQLHKL